MVVCTPTGGLGQARVIVRPIDLEYVHGLLAKTGARRERVEYARRIAFG
jgi:hypothetical protein